MSLYIFGNFYTAQFTGQYNIRQQVIRLIAGVELGDRLLAAFDADGLIAHIV